MVISYAFTFLLLKNHLHLDLLHRMQVNESLISVFYELKVIYKLGQTGLIQVMN